MAKTRTFYSCQKCGAQHAKWMGKCSTCHEWNTLVEEVEQKNAPAVYDWKGEQKATPVKNAPRKLSEIEDKKVHRIAAPDNEFNRVLGGGIVPGSMILLGGEPGIGKSTLLLQIALQIKNLNVLYVSGEESEEQVKLRAQRLPNVNNDCYILTETNTQRIFKHAKTLTPDILVIDSIQTIHSDFLESTPGSVGQIRECTGELQRFAKETHTPVFIVGHITKDGAIAGPKLLEHMVDVVLQFEGDRNYNYRILRTIKNRFGSTAELGIYEMQNEGLREVSNPSEILISEREEAISGVAIAATLEGMRPMLIEVQALVTPAVYGTPQRSATGFDMRRLNMILAVLEKRCGFQFGSKDVFLNIAGGLKVEDPGIDMAIVAALLSSFEDIAIPMTSCFAGEVGLSGEIRSINRTAQRISEADKLGFETIYIAKSLKNAVDQSNFNAKIIANHKVESLYNHLF